MPKTGSTFDDLLSIICFSDLREKLTALGYLRGENSYASTARDLLTRAVEAEIQLMDTPKRRQFDGVLENIRTQTAIQKQKRAEKAARIT